MGLDWSPLPKPRRGFEAEFARLFREYQRASKRKQPELMARVHQISQPPYELLEAPRVGFDPAADEWLRGQLRETGRESGFEQSRKEMHGYYVLDLLPECDGFPIYSNSAAIEELDRYSFRAQFLRDVEDILGDELMNKAYESMLREELMRYGNELLAKARGYARARGVEHVEALRVVEWKDDSDEVRAHIIFAAAKWCLYWAGRGHGMEAWY